MQSLQRCDLLPGAPRAFHSAGKHALKGLTKAEAREAAGNLVAARIDYLARRAAPVDGDGFQVLVAVVCRIRVPSTPGVPPRIGRAVLSAFANSSTPLDAEVSTQAPEANKGRPPGIASNASSQFRTSSKGRSYLMLVRDFSNPSQF
jgi:hypothetical protein